MICIIAGSRPSSVRIQHGNHTVQNESKPSNDSAAHIVPEDAVDSPACEAAGHRVSVENKSTPSTAESKSEVEKTCKQPFHVLWGLGIDEFKAWKKQQQKKTFYGPACFCCCC